MSFLGSSERRSSQRYPIVGRVDWPGGEGLTENVSTSGIYFVTPQRVGLGETLRLRLTLPLQSIPMTGDGVVVRVEPANGGYGVAVRLEALLPVAERVT